MSEVLGAPSLFAISDCLSMWAPPVQHVSGSLTPFLAILPRTEVSPFVRSDDDGARCATQTVQSYKQAGVGGDSDAKQTLQGY